MYSSLDTPYAGPSIHIGMIAFASVQIKTKIIPCSPPLIHVNAGYLNMPPRSEPMLRSKKGGAQPGEMWR